MVKKRCKVEGMPSSVSLAQLRMEEDGKDGILSVLGGMEDSLDNLHSSQCKTPG